MLLLLLTCFTIYILICVRIGFALAIRSERRQIQRAPHGAVVPAPQFTVSRPSLQVGSQARTAAFVVASASALGAAVALSSRYTMAGCAALLVLAILLRAPPLGVITVIALVGVLGEPGAHILVGGLPLMECLLLLAGVAAMLRAVAPQWITWVPLMWIIPGLWGLGELLLRNRGNTISGIREALIFIYPAMFALPFMGVRPARVRGFLLRHGYYICLVGWVVLCIGVYNQLTGAVGVTSSGQSRALSGEFAEPLMAAFFTSLWLYQVGRLRLWTALVCAAPIMGLLLINHRSAYLGAAVTILALLVLRAGIPSVGSRRLGQLAIIGAIGIAVVLVATPLGKSGTSRFLTIGSTTDPNIQERLQRDRLAVPTSTTAWIIGDGVGLAPTDITGNVKTAAVTDPNQSHNSFATMLHLGGLIGLALLLGPIVYVMIKGFAARGDPLVQVLLLFALFTIIMAAFNVVLENAYFGGWFWVTLLLLQLLLQAGVPSIRQRHT